MRRSTNSPIYSNGGESFWCFWCFWWGNFSLGSAVIGLEARSTMGGLASTLAKSGTEGAGAAKEHLHALKSYDLSSSPPELSELPLHLQHTSPRLHGITTF